MIAVTGASGQLGRLVLEGLTARGLAAQTVALARDPQKLAGAGVETRVFDYDRAETLAPALAGVDTLLLISANEFGKRSAQHRAVIDAAKAAGVGQIVYTSILNAPTSILDLAQEHRETEAALAASGIAHTILRNGWYAENYLGSLGGVIAGGAVIGSAGQGRISAAARADYAAAAVAVLADPALRGRVYELAGDTAWTLADYAAEIARQTGRTIPYRDMPAADYATILEGFGLDAGFAGLIAGWDAAAARGALESDSKDLSRLIGRPTTPLSASVATALAALAPAD